MTSPDNEPSLMTAEEVAALLRLKPATIYEAAARGRIPVVRLWRGKRRSVVRFRRSDIEAFIAAKLEPQAQESQRQNMPGGRR